MEFLLSSSNVDVNAQDRNGSTPLFYSVAMGHADCVKMLLDRNADPNWQDRKGRRYAFFGVLVFEFGIFLVYEIMGNRLCLFVVFLYCICANA